MLGIFGVITNVIGLVLCCCWPFNLVISLASLGLGVPAWIMGHKDLRSMKEGRMDPNGRGSTSTGMILGIVSVVLTIVTVLGTTALFFLGFAAQMQDMGEFQ
jgi:hypothetical protein